MGVYKRRDSPFFWLLLERPSGEKGIREPTRIPKTDANRKVAETLYATRMVELSHERRRWTGARHTPKTPAALQLSYVYFISDGKAVKIGRATSVLNRLRALQVSHHAPLEVLAAVPGDSTIESRLHRHFTALRRRGEWFELGDELRALIGRVRTGEHPVAIMANIDHAQNHSRQKRA